MLHKQVLPNNNNNIKMHRCKFNNILIIWINLIWRINKKRRRKLIQSGKKEKSLNVYNTPATETWNAQHRISFYPKKKKEMPKVMYDDVNIMCM